jgi:hypothetical protein
MPQMLRAALGRADDFINQTLKRVQSNPSRPVNVFVLNCNFLTYFKNLKEKQSK